MGAPAQKSIEGTSLAEQGVRTYVGMLQHSESFWAAVLVFLGTLSLLTAIPFYPLPVAFALALACGAVAIKKPPIAVALGFILAMPALSYQSPIFAWVGLLVLAAVFFEVFENWGEIALLELLVLLPFSAFPISLLGGLIFFGMLVGSFYFGSAKSIAISLPAVFLVLLLSSVWLLPNAAFFPLKMSLYSPGIPVLQMGKPALSLGMIAGGIAPAIANMADLNAAKYAGATVGQIASNAMKILFSDSGLIQLIAWGAVLFFAGWFPGNSKSKWKQAIASLSLILIPIAYFFAYSVSALPFNPLIPAYVGAAIFLAVLMDSKSISVSREKKISAKKQMKAFGKFGFADLSEEGGSEKSMDDVGGYQDVKKELRDSIMLPLQRKELASAYGLKAPSGILLFGPPGTGKTMLMRALAKELEYRFVYIKTSDILSQWYGESLPYSEKLTVMDGSGRIKLAEIGKIVEEKQKLKVLSFDKGGKAVFAEIKGWIKHKCTSPIYEVRTRSGRKIKVTGYHSLFALDGMKIENIPTSKLIPGQSYIAVPHSIAFSPSPISEIDFVESLRKDDNCLYVKNPVPYLQEAIKKLGRKKAAQILGYKRESYLDTIINRKVGVRVGLFLELMESAGVEFRKEELRIGSGSKTLPGIIKIDKNMATFLGLWVAEGSYNRRDTVRISTSKEEEEKISSLCKSLFGKITVYAKKGKSGKIAGGRDIYIPSRPLYVLMRNALGLEDGANRKKMPELAFNLSRENLAALLRGYFSGDGSVYENQRGVATVEGATVSRELASQLLHLLLYFRIVGTVYNKKEWSGTNTYRVCMIGGKLLSQFSEIGFLDERRNKRLLSSIERVGWFRQEQVPIMGALKTFVESNLPRWGNSSTIGRGMLAGDFEEDLGIISEENDIYFDRVEEIRKVEDEKSVYDISVGPCQNFVAGFGGIFAHNSEKNISEIFNKARETAPTLLFFDEVDSVGKRRDMAGTDSVTPRVLSVLLQEMDGIKTNTKPVIVVAATNVPDQLDPALLRPGRFDKIVYMHLPDEEARKAIFKVSLKGLPTSPDIDFAALAKKTDRFSGADIQAICRIAMRKAAEEAKTAGKIVPIKMSHISSVLESTKPSTSLSALEDYEKFRLDFERSEAGAAEVEKKKEEVKDVRWEDVAGLADVKAAFKESIELPLLHPELVKEFGVKPTKGILLFGPPGCGKTLVVRAAANELQISFHNVSGAQLMQKGYTHAVNVIKETFNRARENPPAVIFVDEIETFAPSRDSGRADIVGQFLVEMDGVKGSQGVMVVGATNRPDTLDSAILRPGRFDKLLYIHPPDFEGRVQLFKIHFKQFAAGLDLNALAKATEGFTGADIALLGQQVKMNLLKMKMAGKEPKTTTQEVLQMLSGMRPSVTPQMLRVYEKFLMDYGERK